VGLAGVGRGDIVIADVIRAIDLDAGRVVIEPIAGLLE